MNTLVDPNDGALQVPETRDEAASGPAAPGQAALAPAASDATLIELAPESGRTLILPEGPAEEMQRALADRLAGSAAPRTRPAQDKPLSAGAARPSAGAARPLAGVARRWLARAEALFGARDQPRLKRLAPFVVGVASLLATGIPLWFRAPRPPAAEPATLNTVRTAPPLGSPLTVDYPRDREAAPAPDQPAEAAGTTASGARSGARPVAPRLIGGRRGRARAAVTARWKGRAGVLRTRNGSPVVD